MDHPIATENEFEHPKRLSFSGQLSIKQTFASPIFWSLLDIKEEEKKSNKMSNSLNSKHQRSWLCLGGIFLLQSVSVTSSLYPSYSSELRKKFSMSHVQVMDLIAAVETGRLFEWFPTAAADHLPPWTILLIGLLFGSVGYGVQYLYMTDRIHHLSYWQVLLLCLLAGNSICWIQSYCCFAALTNFNKNKSVAAVASCYTSLGRKVYTSLIKGIQGRIGFQNPSTYLLLTCIVPTSVGLVVLLIVGCSKLPMEHTETDVFPIVFSIAVATGVYAVLGTTVHSFKNMSPQLEVITLTLMIMLPLAVPLAEAAHWFTIGRWRSKITPELPCVVTTANCLSISKGLDGMDEEVGEDGKAAGLKVDEGMAKVGNVELGYEHGVKNLIMSWDFWLFFWVNACGPMLGLVYANNLRQISESYGYYEAPSLLQVFATSGFYGRVFSVLIEEYARRRSMSSKPAPIVLMMVPITISFFLLINGSRTGLYIGTSIVGACSGAIRDITAFKISELFGVQNSVVNQNIVLVNIPIGTLLFGHLDVINYKTSDDGNYGICKGFKCHHKTFIIWGSISSIGTILSLILHLRTRKLNSLR